MFLRLLFVLLIAFNIAVGAWLWLGQDDAHGRSATDPDVPALKLLSERPVAPAATVGAAMASGTSAPTSAPAPAQAVAAPVAAPVPPSRPNSYTCTALGPFATQVDLRNARTALGAQAVRMRSRQEQTTQTRGWWVHLPSSGSRDRALEQARKLSAANIGDYFVVSSGDQSNTISLGLFKDPANARKRRDEVVASGFPAQMIERTETVPEYWLDLAIADNAHFDWRTRIRSGVGSHSTGCF
ncbi:SPOR domain-containing protein [Dyella tabacisoli]|uniref:SPOR domain-containing protein n=1 Tax=Dyella tabacisoli TaxID=2282381 RepID=A0A369UNU4_9GAMM|nr:SPOR domain-containing protein [Dyella tabacisoli]RDD81993.1 SPOR domain-containing protein [Dyella tabacisoli]